MRGSIEKAYASGKRALSRQTTRNGWTKLDGAESKESIYHGPEKRTEERIEGYTERDTEKHAEKDTNEKGAEEGIEEHTEKDVEKYTVKNATEKGTSGAGPESGLHWSLSKALFQKKTTYKVLGLQERGLQLLYPTVQDLGHQEIPSEPKFDAEIDIVAIPDLLEQYESSFVHANGAAWLQDLLPNDFLRARIFSFLYNASIFFDDSAVFLWGGGLLGYLRDVRWEEKDSKRPIVFICHGLGGTLCKQALLAAHCQGAENIVAATRAVVFLGTPHWQLPTDMFADIFMERLPLEVHMPSPKPIFARRKEMLLRALRYKALMVDGINNTFRDAKMGIEILSFYSATCDARKRIMSVDTIPKKMRLVDPEDRSNPAVFRAKDKKELPLCSRHLNMGRFHGKTDSHYKALVRRIEVAIARVPASPWPEEGVFSYSSSAFVRTENRLLECKEWPFANEEHENVQSSHRTLRMKEL